MLYICLVIFISFISFTEVYLFISCTKLQLIHFVIHFHLIQFTDHSPSHLHHIWFYSYCIAFQPHCVFRFFNQSRLWKLAVPLDQILNPKHILYHLKLNSDVITTPCYFIRNTTHFGKTIHTACYFGR